MVIRELNARGGNGTRAAATQGISDLQLDSFRNPGERATALQELIQETAADLTDLTNFYNIPFSPTRIQRLGQYFAQTKARLVTGYTPLEDLTPDAQVDWNLLWTYTSRQIDDLRVQWSSVDKLSPLLGSWVPALIDLCERRQKVVPVTGKEAAQILSGACKSISAVSDPIEDGRFTIDRFAAYRAAQQLELLSSRLVEWHQFYDGYDPTFSWWTKKPWQELELRMKAFVALIREHLVGTKPGHEDDEIVGQPLGREGILSDIKYEMIPYTPEELVQIGDREYAWCEKEAIKASREMGFGDHWRKALEHVKNMYVEPGQQTYMVHELAQEAIEYVEKHDMVTVPEIAKDYRTYMMTPERQKVNPFFLGGTSIIVSFPTDTMAHDEKLMSMRGNSRPLSRSTVFHELIPGHHLQYHYMPRSKPHRRLFETPFWIEGWAFYWEMILWDRGFAAKPEEKIGMLFWRMQRCARITFSLKFHSGEWTPQQCIDFLVDRVGHERATAEGEVRRSFNGDYGALYQSGYMLGALQLYKLRQEVVDAGLMSEKQFHDRVLKENTMPIELLRALLKGEKLGDGYQSKWRFYDL